MIGKTGELTNYPTGGEMLRKVIAGALFYLFWILLLLVLYDVFFTLRSGESVFYSNETEQDRIERDCGIRHELSNALAAREQHHNNFTLFSPVPFPEDEHFIVEKGSDVFQFFWGKSIQCMLHSRYYESVQMYLGSFRWLFYFGMILLGIIIWYLHIYRIRPRVRYPIVILISGVMICCTIILSRSVMPKYQRLDRNFESHLVAAEGLLRQKLDAPRQSLLDTITINKRSYPLFVAPADIFDCNYIRLNIDFFTYYFYGPDLNMETLNKLNPAMDYVQVTPKLFRGCYSEFQKKYLIARFFQVADLMLLVGGGVILWICAIRWRPDENEIIPDSCPRGGCLIPILSFLLFLFLFALVAFIIPWFLSLFIKL